MAEFSGAGPEGAGSPGPWAALPRGLGEAGSRFAGAFDFLDPRAGLRGWALDRLRPGRPLAVEVVAVVAAAAGGGGAAGEDAAGGGAAAAVPLARSFAMLPRPDIDAVLGAAAGGPSLCSFLVGWGRFDRALVERLAAAEPGAPVLCRVPAAGGRPLEAVAGEPLTLARLRAALRAAPPGGDRDPAFARLNDYLDAAASGLFDPAWYAAERRRRAAAAAAAGEAGAEAAAGEAAAGEAGSGGDEEERDPLLDYLERGEAAGLRPNPYFDPAGYAAALRPPPGAGGALLHWCRGGFAAPGGADPSRHLDAAWYRARHGLAPGADPLAHFLARRAAPPAAAEGGAGAEGSGRPAGGPGGEGTGPAGGGAGASPNRHFDPAHYMAQLRALPDPAAAAEAAAAAADPYLHYLRAGEALGLSPSPGFGPDARLADLLEAERAARQAERAARTGPEDASAAQKQPTGDESLASPRHYRSPMTHFFSQLIQVREGGPADLPAAAQPAEPGAELMTPVQSMDPAAGHGAADRARHLQAVAASGLFDQGYYLSTYRDIAQAGVDPLEHFFDHGYTEGRRPNPYFDPLWYLETYPAVRQAGVQPLLDYILHGDREGRQPGPLFDTAWYRAAYGIPEDGLALAHYLASLTTCRFSPMPDFDAGYYARNNPDVAAAGIDPFLHFLDFGYREGRNPSAAFDVKFYAQRYLHGDLSQNPFHHYLRHKHEPGVFGRMPEDETSVPREVKRFTKPGPDFEEPRPLPPSALRQVKLLAYYLPQFHAFPENDGWWGTGFTEWTNIVRGLPRFKGHYQPRVPRDLGFYTLDSNEPFRRQVEMAMAGGVHGFVFYYYWFNGKRLMEKPVWRFLEDQSIQMPFCLMWANENWTRRWDGAESEVLISQDYRPDDDERMAAEFAQHFKDPRYIRVQGRPLLMIYRPALIPDPARTIARWREIFRTRFAEDPILVMAQSFGDTDPTPFGMDGAIEFPPHKLTQHLEPINPTLEYLDADFKGKVVRYDDVVDVSLAEPAPAFPLIKTAVPSWDNDARRQGTGMTVTGSTPAKYEAWLGRLVKIARERPFFGEPIVCVNAWNEWCEGAYLEPDLHFGSAYLNATARAVCGQSRGTATPRLLLVGHDAFPSGAQQLLLNMGRVLHRSFGLDVEFLLLGDGRLVDAYKAVAPTTVAADDAAAVTRLKALAGQGFAHAIVNTTAAARIVDQAKAAGIEPIVLVHELPRIIREKHLEAGARLAVESARTAVFPAPFVRDELLRELGAEPSERTVILPQGVYKDVAFRPEAGARLRAELGLAERDSLVVGVGYADLRKGFDLFLQLWRQLGIASAGGRVHLAWVGGIDPGLKDWLAGEIAGAEATGTFHMMGYREDMDAVFSAADGFALTSREDPFPSVALEALSVGIPVFAFDRSGGIPDMLRETGEGTVVPYGDVTAMAAAVAAALRAGITLAQREARHALVADRFAFKPYVRRLLDMAMPGLPSVSVAVPNYNYARYMPERLGSIFQQSHPVHEVLVLDDCSKDDSAEVIPAVAAEWDREIRYVPNEVNSGSVFAQWRKAAELATGEFLWIAEADDLSERDFLTRTLALMRDDPSVQLAFSDSRTVHVDGTPQWATYKPYYGTVEPGALGRTQVFEARDFVARMLSVKNLILNVSAVVWRRDALLRALDACQAELKDFRMAGDWRLYLEALALPGARVAYEAEPLNVHRRHAESVTHALKADLHVAEIDRCQAMARQAFALSGPVAERQAAYLAEVAEQLGAAAAQSPSSEKGNGEARARKAARAS